MRASAFWTCVAIAAACSSSNTAPPFGSGPGDGGSHSDGGGNGPDGATGDDAGTTGDDGGGSKDSGPPPVPMCVETCSASSDCATAGYALYDANHYQCTGGYCAWLGCKADSDCTQAYQSQKYACGTVQGLSVPSCYEKCNTQSDCGIASVTLYSASHYQCSGGQCVWQGCQADSECKQAFQKSNYACGSVQGINVPSCYETCGAPADCATAGYSLYDANHYACDSGRCDWLGCKTNGDCTQAFQKQNYACH